MIRRKLIFGIAFIVLGGLFLAGASIEFDWRSTSEAKDQQDHPSQWHLITEPSLYEESAVWTGLISVLLGFAFLGGVAVKSIRRKPT